MNNNFYYYKRVSTNKQKLDRQNEAIVEWQKQNNISIPSENIFEDVFTGRTFNREQYQILINKLKPNDYLIVKEIDRLGRDWDGIKAEWKRLHDDNINIIVVDLPILSDNLPNQKSMLDTLETKLIKEQLLELMCYSAQKERERISQRTKEGLNATRIRGTKLGRPREENSNKENFIKTLEFMINNNAGQERASIYCNYPLGTLKNDLKGCYKKYNTKDYKEILERMKKGE